MEIDKFRQLLQNNKTKSDIKLLYDFDIGEGRTAGLLDNLYLLANIYGIMEWDADISLDEALRRYENELRLTYSTEDAFNKEKIRRIREFINSTLNQIYAQAINRNIPRLTNRAPLIQRVNTPAEYGPVTGELKSELMRPRTGGAAAGGIGLPPPSQKTQRATNMYRLLSTGLNAGVAEKLNLTAAERKQREKLLSPPLSQPQVQVPLQPSVSNILNPYITSIDQTISRGIPKKRFLGIPYRNSKTAKQMRNILKGQVNSLKSAMRNNQARMNGRNMDKSMIAVNRAARFAKNLGYPLLEGLKPGEIAEGAILTRMGGGRRATNKIRHMRRRGSTIKRRAT